jgi:hypothetical protein
MKLNITKLFLNKGLLLFINGILLSSCFYFKTESKYEDALFEGIVDEIKSQTHPDDNLDSFFVSAMRMTRTLEYNRQQIFGGKKISGVKAVFFRPATIDLMTGDGACGSYSTVLARMLKAAGYQVRIAQMTVNGIIGGHMVVEVKKRSDWIVLDPLLQQYFKKPDGSMASFNDVHDNWAYYQKQTDSNYVTAYKYEGVNYTNWNKVKYLGPAAKRVFELALGIEKTKEIAIRSYILRKYNFLYLLSLSAFVLSCISVLISFRLNRIKYAA